MTVDEKPESYTIIAHVPGVLPEDFTVSVEGNVLTVHAVQRSDTTGNSVPCSTFAQSLAIPADADSDLLSSEYDYDKASIEVPKAWVSVDSSARAESNGDAQEAANVRRQPSEAESLAAWSPRFKRWLKAHGCLK